MEGLAKQIFDQLNAANRAAAERIRNEDVARFNASLERAAAELRAKGYTPEQIVGMLPQRTA